MEQNINYDEPVSGRNLDYATYNAKFETYDKADENEKAKLWKDFTLYAYAFFKDKTDKPYRLTAYQDAIATRLLKYDFNPHNPERFCIFRAYLKTSKHAQTFKRFF